jgi:V/A-type H+/Na+-transporting ATPase subunit K
MFLWMSRHALAFNVGIALGILLLLIAASMGGIAARGDAPTEGGEQPVAKAAGKPPITWQDATRMFAAALAIGVSAFATAVTQCRIGSAGVGALAENPKLFGSILIFLVIPETMVILGFVIAAMIVL